MKTTGFLIYLLATWIGIVMIAARYEQLNQTLKEVLEHQKRFERVWIDESQRMLGK